MKKGAVIAIIAGVVLVLAAGFFLLMNNGNGNANDVPHEGTGADANQDMVDCGMMQNPSCFGNRMANCLPVKAQLTGTDGSSIEISILGYENQTCHFQRKINSVVNMNCYFRSGTTMNWDLIDQTFGNDKGMQQTVDADCKPAL